MREAASAQSSSQSSQRSSESQFSLSAVHARSGCLPATIDDGDGAGIIIISDGKRVSMLVRREYSAHHKMRDGDAEREREIRLGCALLEPRAAPSRARLSLPC